MFHEYLSKVKMQAARIWQEEGNKGNKFRHIIWKQNEMYLGFLSPKQLKVSLIFTSMYIKQRTSNSG